MEACFAARFPQEGTGRGAPDAQEFIVKTTQALQEARAIRGNRCPPGVAPHPAEGGELRVCIDIPGLSRAASQERFWPSRDGRCEGPPHSYVRMPFGLPNTAAAHQRLMRSILEAQVARHRAFLEEMEMDLEEPPRPPRASRGSGLRRLMRPPEDRLLLHQERVMPGLLSCQMLRRLRWKAATTLGRPNGMGT